MARPRREVERELEQSGVWDELSAIGGSAICLGCGCTDFRPCVGGCSWVAIDEERNLGLCSQCAIVPVAELVARSETVMLQLASLANRAQKILAK